MNFLFAGIIIGAPCGWALHKGYVRSMWDISRAFKNRAKGRK